MNERAWSMRDVIAKLIACLLVAATSSAAETQGRFTHLVKLPAPKIVDSATAFPGGRFNAANILDGNVRTEYASHGKGANTFIEFDFGKPVSIAAFQHQDRNDVALVAASELVFSDAVGQGHRHGIGDARRRAQRRDVLAAGEAGHGPTRAMAAHAIAAEGQSVSGRGRDRLLHEPAVRVAAEGSHGRHVAGHVDRAKRRPACAGAATGRRPIRMPSRAKPCSKWKACRPRTLRLSFGRQELTLAIPEVKSPRPVRYALRVQGQAVVEGQWTDRAGAPDDDLHHAAFPRRHRLHGASERDREEADAQPGPRHGTGPGDGRLSGRRPLQVERRGALGGRELPARSLAGEAAGVLRRRAQRAGRACRPCTATS